MTTTQTPKWSSKARGLWATQDGRWTASARWDSIRHDHWVLLVGDGQGPVVVSRATLREIKAIVADPNVAALYVENERQHLIGALAHYQAKLDEAETNDRPGQGHIIQHRLVARNNAKRNLNRFEAALEAVR